MAEIPSALVDQILNARFGSIDKGFELRAVNAQGGDETWTLVDNADHTVSIRSPNGQQWLSIQEDGSRQSRPSDQPPGPWEKFTRTGQILTELPKDHPQPPDRLAVQFVQVASVGAASPGRRGQVRADGHVYQDDGPA